MRIAALALVVSACGAPGRAPVAVHHQAPAIAVVPTSPAIPLDPAVRHGTLGNGLDYYLENVGDPKIEHEVNATLVIRAGSVDELDGQVGAAQLVAVLARQGTKHFGAADLEEAGGAVTYDSTSYDFYIPADAAALDHTLDVFRDVAGHITFDPAAFAAARTALAVSLDDYARYDAVALRGSRYATRTWRGSPEAARLTREQLLAFYHAQYQPQQMAIVVAGPIDVDATERAIVAKFDDLVRGRTVRVPAPVPVETATAAVVVDTHVPFTVQWEHRVPPRPVRTEADLRASLVRELLGRLFGTRMERLKSADGPFHFGAGGTRPFVRSLDLDAMSMLPKPGKVPEVLDALAAEVGRVEQHGYLASELERGVRRMSLEPDAAPRRDGGGENGRLTKLALGGDTPPAFAWEVEARTRLLASITLAEINAIAMAPRPGTVFVASDEWHPPPGEVLARFTAARAKPQPVWIDDFDHPWIHPPPVGGTTIATAHDDVFDATVWTLGNGIRVIAKRICCGREVAVELWRPVGGASVPDGRFALDAGTHLGFENTGNLWSPLCCSYNYRHDSAAARIALSAEITGDKLERLFQRIHVDFTRSPRRDPQAFAGWQKDRRKNLFPYGNGYEEYGRQVADQQLGRGPAISAAMIDAVDLDRTLAAYHALFADFTGTTVVVTGHFDPAQLKRFVEIYLGGLPTGHPLPAPVRAVPVHRGIANATFRPVDDYACTQWLASSRPATADDDPRDAHVLELVLGDALERHASFHVTPHVTLDPVTHTRELRLMVECGHPYGFSAALPAALVPAMRAFVRDGLDAKQLAELRDDLAMPPANEWHVQEAIVNAYRDGWRNDELLERATAERIRDTARRYFDGQNFVTGTVK